MSDLTPSAFQHVINGLSKIKHAPHHAPELYSSAAKLLKESFGSDDLGVVLVNALKSESHESVGTFLMQLEYSDLGVLALVKSPSLSLALQAVIDSKNIKILNAVLDIILKAETLSGDLSSFDINAIESLFEKVLRLIPSEDLTISERACKLTESIISNSRTNESLLRLMFSESIRYAETEKNLYLRFINVFARIMSKSDELFESCNGCGAAEAVISLCRNRDDILVQIVAMELITEFAKTSSGLQYLFTFGVIDWLVAVTTSEEDASLLGSQALRQLGDVFATASSNSLMADEVWDAINKDLIGKYLLTVRTYLDSRSEADRLTGLHALSSFASSHQAALETVMNDNILLESWLSLLNSGKVEILTAALSSVARVIDMGSETPSGSRSKASQLSSLLVMQGTSESKASSSAVESSASSSSGLVALKKRIITEIGKVKGVPAVAYLMKTARQPVNERKQAVYALMTALCRQQPGGWGLMVLYGTQGFREFIEDRSTEHTKEGKEAKFCLIKSVAECPQFVPLISTDISNAVLRMVDQGPYHKAAILEDPMTMEL